MHVISGMKKLLAPTMIGAVTAAEAPAMPSAKRPTATEMCEEEIRVGMEQTSMTYNYRYRKKRLMLPLN
jgi:hypothetical protein